MTPRIPRKPKAFSYIRWSSPEQAKGDSLRRQTQKAEEFAARHGYELDGELTFKDAGVSSFRGRNASHGALRVFLRAVEDGLIPAGSCLILESIDRLSREGAWDALPVLQEIINAKISLGFPPERIVDRAGIRASPWMLMELLLGLIRANEESATKSDRLRHAWAEKRARASRGEVQTTRAPAWILAEGSAAKDSRSAALSLIPERAAIVRRIFDSFLSGIGKKSIAEIFNEEKLPTWGAGVGRKPAAYWHASYIHKILTSPTVTGRLVPHSGSYDDDKVFRRDPKAAIPDYYPRAISDEEFDRAQTLLTARKQTARSATTASIVAGLARCPHCGGTMTRIVKGKKGGPPKLICAKAKNSAGCTYHLVKLPEVEAALIGAASGMATPPLADNNILDEIRGADASLDAVNEKISALVDLIESKPSPALSKRLAERETEAAQLQETLKGLRNRAAETESRVVKLRAERLSSTLALYSSGIEDAASVNAAMREALTSVVIDYQRGALVLNWRHGPSTEVAVPEWIFEEVKG